MGRAGWMCWANHCKMSAYVTSYLHVEQLCDTVRLPGRHTILNVTITVISVCTGADQRKHQSSASLAFVRESTVTGGFPSQRDSNAENVSIWWRYHGKSRCRYIAYTMSTNQQFDIVTVLMDLILLIACCCKCPMSTWLQDICFRLFLSFTESV